MTARVRAGVVQARTLMASPQSRCAARGVASDHKAQAQAGVVYKAPAQDGRPSGLPLRFLLLPPLSSSPHPPAHSSMGADTRFQNIRVYCAYYLLLPFVRISLRRTRIYPGLAFIAYWGIVLFGYDT